jgi:hypothetical protein
MSAAVYPSSPLVALPFEASPLESLSYLFDFARAGLGAIGSASSSDTSFAKRSRDAAMMSLDF